MQAKLLRVLQERRFERVGGTESIEVDVRVVAATNRSLEHLVKHKTFREDLFYRLNVVKIDLLPLRDRPEDIPLLAVHFTEKYALPGESPKQISPRVMEVLLNYPWPGNIRELENTIERACVTSREHVIELENLPANLLNPAAPRLPFHIDLKSPLPDVLRKAVSKIEQQYLAKALRQGARQRQPLCQDLRTVAPQRDRKDRGVSPGQGSLQGQLKGTERQLKSDMMPTRRDFSPTVTTLRSATTSKSRTNPSLHG